VRRLKLSLNVCKLDFNFESEEFHKESVWAIHQNATKVKWAVKHLIIALCCIAYALHTCVECLFTGYVEMH